MAAFVPPLWSKFGINIRDVLNKKYNYKNQLIFKSKPASDVAVESSITQMDGSAFNGAIKATYIDRNFQSEVNLSTHPNEDRSMVSSEIKTTNLYEGLVVGVKASDMLDLKTTAEFKHEGVAASLSSTITRDSSCVEAAIVGGDNGVSFGAQSKYCSVHGIMDYNIGVETSGENHVLTLKTENISTLNASYWCNLLTKHNNVKTQVGGEFKCHLLTRDKLFTVGMEHTIDEKTTFKNKCSTDGSVAAVIEHRINPLMKLSLSTGFTATSRALIGKKLGVALTFGEE